MTCITTRERRGCAATPRRRSLLCRRLFVTGVFYVGCVLTLAAAFDADTLAFYPFADGAVGENVTTVANAVGQSYGGVRDPTYQGSPVFSADAPGAYVFPSRDATEPICVNPGSVSFANNDNADKSAVVFSNLAGALADLDGYTIECFYRVRERDTYKPAINYTAGCNYILDLPSGSEGAQVRLFNNATGINKPRGASGYFVGYEYVESTGERHYLDDGLWHHVAIVRNKATEKNTLYCDYSLGGSFTSTNGTADAGNPLLIGCGNFQGEMSCLRVTAKALDSSEFIYASDDPGHALPDTVFHFRMTGAEGVQPNVLTSHTASAIIRWDQLNVAITNLTNATRPVFSSSVPPKPCLIDGEDGNPIGLNVSSLRFDATPKVSGAYFNTGPGFKVGANSRNKVKDFTLEFFMDPDESPSEQNTLRYNLFGLSGVSRNKVHHYSWQLLMIDGSSAYPTKLAVWCNVVTSRVDGVACVRNEMNTQVDKTSLESINMEGWHHVALTYSEADTRLRLYVDYKPVTLMNSIQNDNLVDGDIHYPLDQPDDAKSWYFGNGLNAGAFDGLIDEIRLTRRVLQPSEFLHLRNALGTVLVVR